MVFYISAPVLLNIPYLSPPSGSCPPRFAPRPQPAPSLRSGPGASLGGQRSGDFAPSLSCYALEKAKPQHHHNCAPVRHHLRSGPPPCALRSPSSRRGRRVGLSLSRRATLRVADGRPDPACHRARVPAAPPPDDTLGLPFARPVGSFATLATPSGELTARRSRLTLKLQPCYPRPSSKSGVRSGLCPQRAYLSATAYRCPSMCPPLPLHVPSAPPPCALRSPSMCPPLPTMCPPLPLHVPSATPPFALPSATICAPVRHHLRSGPPPVVGAGASGFRFRVGRLCVSRTVALIQRVIGRGFLRHPRPMTRWGSLSLVRWGRSLRSRPHRASSPLDAVA